MIIIYLLFCLASYLLGAVPFAYLLVRHFRHIDIREHGSGNVGSTNALRAGGWRIALPVLLCDVCKGLLIALCARRLGGDLLLLTAGVCAVLGHLYPVWLDFRGGKGVAIFIGLTLAVQPVLLLYCLLLWLLTALLGGYVSAASCLLAVAIPVGAVLIGAPWLHTALFGMVAALVILRHRDNLRRIADHSEPRMIRIFPWQS